MEVGILQELPQLLQPEPEAALHGAEWDAELLCDLRVGETAEVGELDTLTLLIRQRGQGSPDLVAGQRPAYVLPHILSPNVLRALVDRRRLHARAAPPNSVD